MNPAFDQLAAALERSWQRSDAIFDLLGDGALHARPIALRHPFLFYLGHLPAFAWNHIGVGALGAAHVDAAFEDLFERGIDPDTDAADSTDDAAAGPAAWPEPERVLAYRDAVRAAVREALPELERRCSGDVSRPEGQVAHAVLEHELMHHETLLYMLAQLDERAKRAPSGGARAAGVLGTPDRQGPARDTPITPYAVSIPAGTVRLGATPGEVPFGWDNEFPARTVSVPAFRIDALPVTNGDLLAFVDAGGYADPRHWTRDDWRWAQAAGLELPSGWRRVGATAGAGAVPGAAPGANGPGRRAAERFVVDDHVLLGAFGSTPLGDALDLPVSVSLAEAGAFARWCGRRLPTEAEWQRAAHGTPDGDTRPHPWGEQPFEASRGNAHFDAWGPTPVGCHTAGTSAFGVHDLVGQGWEWTTTPFAPYPGFRVTLPTYAGYSADFFDDGHCVMLGGSWATDSRLLRRSLRNWFRPHYPYVFASFRLVD